ncbi:MAG: S9 family peptidase [Hyphomicrobiaceae bacterium]
MSSSKMSQPIARRKLFGNPDRAMVRLSPDGKYISWLAPANGVMNVWVAPRQEPAAARAVTRDTKRGIRVFGWSLQSPHVLYMQDTDGDENWHIHATTIDTGETTDLTPYPGVNARWMGQSWTRPGLLAIGMNDRDAAWHDLYLVDVVSAKRTLVFENSGQYGGMTLDRDLGLRLVEKPEADGGRTIHRIEAGKTEAWLRIPHADSLTTGIEGFTANGETLYLSSSLGRDKAALYALDWVSGEQCLLAEHDKVDIGRVLTHPVTYVAEAYQTHYLTGDWQALTPDMEAEIARIKRDYDPEFDIVSRTRADDLWVMTAVKPERPGQYHLYDRAAGRFSFLFESRPELADERLARMHPVVIPSRDGLELVSYLTLPAAVAGDRPPAPLAMVLNVHGGPWSQDSYAYDPEHQWLADRGYAVLSVNFRSSTGFGKSFITAGDGQWAGKMHEDLLDAVDWAVREGIADRSKVAIMGGSYGGYATLAALTFTPEVFACGVDIVGPSNLETLLATVPPYWAAFFETLARAVGDPRTEAGRALLRDRSPLHRADRIVRPLLIAQGANDPRVKQAESDQIVEAMRKKGLPVTYVLYPEEGHGFAVPENRIAFYAIAEAFLATHLGGRAEPMGEALSGARLEVPEGADAVPGLRLALAGA